MAIFMGATTWGPVLGPVISGFGAVITWRWIFWLCLILAGVTWVRSVTMEVSNAADHG